MAIKAEPVVAVERYEMALNHITTHPEHMPDTSYTLSITVVDDEDLNFHLFEVSCECGWWDHWDERKEP